MMLLKPLGLLTKSPQAAQTNYRNTPPPGFFVPAPGSIPTGFIPAKDKFQTGHTSYLHSRPIPGTKLKSAIFLSENTGTLEEALKQWSGCKGREVKEFIVGGNNARICSNNPRSAEHPDLVSYSALVDHGESVAKVEFAMVPRAEFTVESVIEFIKALQEAPPDK